MNAIVTIATESYAPLVPLWYERVKCLTDLPVYVLGVGDISINIKGINFIKIDAVGNPFPIDTPDHACAEKMRIFEHMPRHIENVLFIDADVMVLNKFWDEDIFIKSKQSLIISPDLFVGYKEKMETEFRSFDSGFSMKYFPDGKYFYFNTGVFFASRETHANHFSSCLKIWQSYVDKIGHFPSIFDQNIFNYYIVSRNLDITPMPIQNNCLRQYPYIIENSIPWLDGLVINAFHLNGGDPTIKLLRWKELENKVKFCL